MGTKRVQLIFSVLSVLCAVSIVAGASGCAAETPATVETSDVAADSTAEADTSVPVDDVPPTPDTAADDVPATEVEEDVEDVPVGPLPGSPCDDADPCTDVDVVLENGSCAGVPKDCDDKLDCTEDSCGAGLCNHVLGPDFCLAKNAAGEPVECVADGEIGDTLPCEKCDASVGVPSFLEIADGVECDDHDACTSGDLCLAGECVAFDVKTCPEKGPCVSAACDPVLECNYPPIEGECDDGSKCTQDDACKAGACKGDPVVCNDDDPCTDDKCTDKKGCVTSPSALCDDGDPCTTNFCKNLGECSKEENLGACEDGEPCTTGEACVEHVCKGGVLTECDDGTPCTLDFCEAGLGCEHYFLNEETCTDGFGCTFNDHCVAGLCLGTKGACNACPLPKTTKALKVVGMTFPSDGEPGSGLDIDGDPATCAPEGSCSGGIDNAMGILAGVINDPLQESMELGSILYVVDLSQLTTDGEPFTFSVLDTKLSEASEAQDCDYMQDECGYNASLYSYDPACKAYFGLDNAVVTGNTFSAGGHGAVMTIAVALGSTLLPITLINAQVSGYVKLDPITKEVSSMSGIFAGASPKQQLYDTIANIDPSLLPVDKELVLTFINDILQNDIDLDKDGTKDAASVAIRFVTIPANLE